MESIGKYQIIKKLGAGGFGAVYLANDPRLSEQVAIKLFLIRDDNLAQQATTASGDAGDVLRGRFLNEARTLRKLQRNPHIVEVFDFDELDDGTPYYVMPYLPRSLKDELGSDATDAQVIAELPAEEKPRRLPLAQCWLYLEQLLIALKDVHNAGLIHRDIKPANLLFDDHGDVKLCDFGIAKVPDSEHSYSGIGMGSRNYMAPEQRQSAKHVDARSDVYSVGVLAYRMITGTLPEGRYADPIHYQPALNEAQNAFILQALSQQKDQRFANGGDMLSALKAVQSGDNIIPDESTSTWVGESSSQLRPELKPLEDKIIAVLHAYGEVSENQLPVVRALAELAGLTPDEQDTLIYQIAEQQAQQNPQQKAFQQWVAKLSALRESGEIPNQSTRQALLEAAVMTTGRDKATLSTIMTNYLGELTAQTGARGSAGSQKPQQAQAHSATQEKPVSSKATTQHKPHEASPSPDPERDNNSRRWVWLALIILLIGSAGGGYYYYAVEQEAQATRIARDTAAAKRKLEQTRQEANAAWETAKATHTSAGYAAYIDNWPRGEHITEARQAKRALDEAALEASKRIPFYVNTMPQDAKVRILNIGPGYDYGMQLLPGRYEVEVSKPGFDTYTGWYVLSQVNNTLSIEINETVPSVAEQRSVSPDYDVTTPPSVGRELSDALLSEIDEASTQDNPTAQEQKNNIAPSAPGHRKNGKNDSSQKPTGDRTCWRESRQ